MTFTRAFAATYRDSIAFLIACPLLALLPVAFELLQHVAEVHIGMYDSIAAAKATEHHPLRMAFGMAKVVSLVVPGYWVVRFLAYRDARLAGRWERMPVRLFAGVLAFEAAMAAIQLFALPQTGAAIAAALLIGQIVDCLIPAWTVAAALGNPAIGPMASIRIMARQMPWTFVFLLAAMLPLMIPHYMLGAAALLGGKAWLWPVLILDSLLVGWLAVVMSASAYHAALRASRIADVPLTDEAPAAA